MLGTTIEAVQADRIEMTRAFVREHGVAIALKGAHTVIGSPDGHVAINPTGNPGMAKGGSGDVLTGIVGALLARGRSGPRRPCTRLLRARPRGRRGGARPGRERDAGGRHHRAPARGAPRAGGGHGREPARTLISRAPRRRRRSASSSAPGSPRARWWPAPASWGRGRPASSRGSRAGSASPATSRARPSCWSTSTAAGCRSTISTPTAPAASPSWWTWGSRRCCTATGSP